jgi:hypothetical protein
MYFGRTVKEYNETAEKKIKQILEEGRIRCENCTQPMKRHSSYIRGIKETGQKVAITVIYCKACKKYHVLLPDFLLPYKQYSGNEIESVIIDSATLPTIEIETAASESTVRRWITQIGERLKMAMGILKYLFMQMGQIISEIMIEVGHTYSELEQVLEMAPENVKYSGNRLGLANIWLGKHSRKELI